MMNYSGNGKIKSQQSMMVTGLEAEGVGFEPTVPVKVHLISSQGRYSRFDTLPNLFHLFISGKKIEKQDRKHLFCYIIQTRKSLRHKDFRESLYRISHIISSQPRYDRFDTSPGWRDQLPH